MIDLKEFVGKEVFNKRNEKGTIKSVSNGVITVLFDSVEAPYEINAFDKGFLKLANEVDFTAYKIEQVKSQIERSDANINQILEELNSLVGLDAIKEQINDLIYELKIYKYRNAFNLKVPEVTRHMMFLGNPGTGKTTVARIVSTIYKALGLIDSDKITEVDRGDLVAEYEGQTTIKTKGVITKALGGVLFIDEAYNLVLAKNDNYGHEAVGALVKGIEDYRNDLIVILAGYADEMKRFLASNPGLASRFKRAIYFTDYSSEELYDIFVNMFLANDYVLSEDASKYAKEYFAEVKSISGNGRTIRNMFEDSIKCQSKRIVMSNNFTKETLTLVNKEDIMNALANYKGGSSIE